MCHHKHLLPLFVPVLVVSLLLSGVVNAAGSPPSITWASLERRPLHLPRLRPGSPCPTARFVKSRGEGEERGEEG